MQNFVSIYYLVFGLVTILGGFYGYIRKKSKASLIAGLIYGISLIVCSRWINREVLAAASVALVICIFLFLRFFMFWSQLRKTMPHVPMMVLSLVGIVSSVIILLRIV